MRERVLRPSASYGIGQSTLKQVNVLWPTGKKLERKTGLEPATFGLGSRRSTN